MLGFSIPVSKANELFAADFSVFTHQATGEQAIRTLSFSIPSALTSHVEFVHPTTAYAPLIQSFLRLTFFIIIQVPGAHRNSPFSVCPPSTRDDCLSRRCPSIMCHVSHTRLPYAYLPSCLLLGPIIQPFCDLVEAQYGIPASVPSQTASQIGVSGFIKQFAQQADLTVRFIFFKLQYLHSTCLWLSELPQSFPSGSLSDNCICPPNP